MLLLTDFIELPPHEALDRENRVRGIGHRLALGRLTDEALTILRESDDRGGRARALEFSKTTASPPSMTAMQEFVVPKSIPKTFAIKL
jgi:hypothetical protein